MHAAKGLVQSERAEGSNTSQRVTNVTKHFRLFDVCSDFLLAIQIVTHNVRDWNNKLRKPTEITLANAHLKFF